MTELDRHALLEGFVAAALEAGRVIHEIYASDFAVNAKSDASPVTEADTAAEAVILKALARLAPDIPVVAEEEVAAGRMPQVGERFFLVDPLDGTKEFIKRRPDFTVNIALVEDGRPTLGVVHPPERHTVYAGDVTLGSAWIQEGDGRRRPLRVRRPGTRLTAVASASHSTPAVDDYLAACEAGERVSIGSSLKFCLVAAGEADIYPRPSPTCEWDTGAGDAVLCAAGGGVFGPDGAPLAYGKPRFFNPGFVAAGPFTPPAIGTFL